MYTRTMNSAFTQFNASQINLGSFMQFVRESFPSNSEWMQDTYYDDDEEDI